MIQGQDQRGVAGAAMTLDRLPVGAIGMVQAVHAPAHAPEWKRLLDEIGFVAGERVEVMVRGVPGGDPLTVRIGESTFALRRAEAECIEVRQEGGAQ